MADLFDMRVGGAGWHLTSHLIAIAALFVACFAITGYITFRDDSIPGDALKDEDADVKALVADSLKLESGGKITFDGATTTEIDGDLSSKTTVTKYELVDGSVIKYRVVLSLNGFVNTNQTANDILGITAGAASTIVNLPTNFVLTSGQVRNSVASGGTSSFDLVLSSTDNQAEDTAIDTDGTSLEVFSAINANSASTNFEPFKTVPLEAAPSTMRFLYLTNSGTGNGTTNYTAGELVIDLVGYINNNSITTAFAGPLARPFLRPVKTAVTGETYAESDSGSIIYIDDLDANVTLPSARAGLEFTFICGGVMDAATITCATGDAFFGNVKVTSTTADKTSSDEVVVAGGTVADSNVITLDGDSNTSGGNAGDTIHIIAINDTAWRVNAVLLTTGNAPAAINVLG